MPTDIDELRELARAYWAGRPIPCPKHPGAILTGSFVQTTFADHIFLSCPKGREAITIPQAAAPSRVPGSAGGRDD